MMRSTPPRGKGLNPETFALFRYNAPVSLDWDHLDLTLAHHGRLRCEPGWRLAPEWSERLCDYDFWLVWAGRGTMTLRDRRIELRPGVALWIRPGGLYLGDHDPARPLGVSFMHFDLTDRRTGGRPDDADLPVEVHRVSDTPFVDGVLRRANDLMPQRQAGPRNGNGDGDDDGDRNGEANTEAGGGDGACRSLDGRAAATALMRGLLIDFDYDSRRAEAQPRRTAAERLHREVIAEAAARLASGHAHAADRVDPRRGPRAARGAAEPAIADLAAQAGYSPDHFSRVFRDIMGQSPRDYLVNARIDRARQLLSESSLTVSQVADALGYRDVYFFSRQFKQRTGQSPTQYRKGAAARA